MTKKAVFQQGYEIQQEGNKQVISFGGDGLSWAAYVVFPIAVPFFLLSITLVFPASWWPVLVALILGFAYLIYTTFQRQSFTLTPSGIVKGGVEYDLDRVTEVFIDNPLDKNVMLTGQPMFVFGGSGVAGASFAATGAMANATTSAMAGASIAIGRSSAKRRYRVMIRYGSKTIKLGRNLKQDRAIALFNLLTTEQKVEA
ncbi:hypothetical protein OS189_15435 [Sulfitobacter sp. F26169L]|uniref:hypothetical protein n=1 Tax=Sulfitobacter sp. F26169L TaxID=2996015 RepID=UPI002260BE81|nr:hypothetical protein [Sulfitobacter sp. F26169L]MCX7567737.1 hypothetical protein [Sulfitobacter sp. F26169L]